jgi:hypothetical protein
MNNSATDSWRFAYQCAVLETAPALMANRIDSVPQAIRERFDSKVPIDAAESAEIESARNSLAVLRGEWFGGLEESMTGSVSLKPIVLLDLYRTSPGQTEWLGTFRHLDFAKAKLEEISSAIRGHYVIFDHTTGEEVFAEGCPGR